jgi:meso-butanediol dehydrogenase/(S,S)-butanediol dehydrogenase/diacetyl reductase
MEQRLTGKVAIVTGAGQGIGKGIALRLAREGAAVVIAEYNPDTAAAAAQDVEAVGRRALAYPIDIAQRESSIKMVEDVVDQLGRIDILVNNAGVMQTKPMLDLTEADWDRVINVNQRGMFFCLQAVAAQMIKQLPKALRDEQTLADIMTIKAQDTSQTPTDLATSYGKIVNLSSISGRRGRPLATHYAATKASVISITQSAALALAPYHIQVNAICPGLVPTPMWQQIDAERGELFGSQPGEAVDAFIKVVPLKRAATPADIGGAVAFFCSADADYITGQALNVDGGYEMD